MVSVYRSALGTFRVSPLAALADGTKRFEVFMIIDGQDRPLGTIFKGPHRKQPHSIAPANLPDADHLLGHVADLIR